MEGNNNHAWKETIGKDQARLLPSGHAIHRVIEKETAILRSPPALKEINRSPEATCMEGNNNHACKKTIGKDQARRLNEVGP